MGWTKPLRGEHDAAEPDSKCDLTPSSEGPFPTNDEVTPRWKHCQMATVLTVSRVLLL